MAHRNGLPKVNASARTQRRYRLRHDIPTVEDKQRVSFFQFIKQKILREKEEAKKQ